MWPNPQESADLVTFTEEILNGKVHFLCSEIYLQLIQPETFDFLTLRSNSKVNQTLMKKLLLLKLWKNQYKVWLRKFMKTPVYHVSIIPDIYRSVPTFV